MFRHFYVVLIPAIWLIVDAINFRFPGDEYGGWAAGSLPGLWILLFVGNSGNTSGMLPFVLPAGSATMAALGWAMDKLRAPAIPRAGLWLVVAAALAAHALDQYPSWERALAKNGSVQAYVLPAVNLGLLASTVLTIAAMCLIRFLHATGAREAKFAKPPGVLDV